MPDARTSDIVSDVRLNLGQVGVQNLLAGEIYEELLVSFWSQER